MVETNTRLMKLNQITVKCAFSLYLYVVKILLISFSAISRIGFFSCNYHNGKCWVILKFGLFLRKSLKQVDRFFKKRSPRMLYDVKKCDCKV